MIKSLAQNKFARNWSLLTISNILCQVMGMVATFRVARVLAPEGFGVLGIVQVNSGLGVVLAAFGLRQVITRECARHPEKSLGIFRSSALLQSLLFIPVAAAILFYSVWISGSLTLSLGCTSLLLFWGMLMWQLLESLAFGHERMEFSSALNLAGSLLWVIFAWSVPASFLTPLTVCLVFAILQSLKAGGYLIGVVKAGILKASSHKVPLQFLFVKGLPFYWLAILTATGNQLPILFLTERSGAMEVGLYSAGLKLARPMQMMIQTLMLSLYPGFSKLSLSDPIRYMKLIQRSLLTLVFGGILLSSFITIFRIEILTLLFGVEFKNAAMTLVLQIWYFTLVCIFNLIGMTLAASDRQNWLSKLATVYALIALPCLWYGSSLGSVGLAAAVLITAGVNMTYHWIFFKKSLQGKLPVTFGLLVFGGILGTMFVSLAVNEHWLWLTRFFIYLLISGFLSVPFLNAIRNLK